MPIKHVAWLLLVITIWGVNFVAIKFGLNEFPPFTFSAMRFLGAVFPVIFFVKRPNLPLHKLALFGLFMFAGQFTFLYLAIHTGISAGLASLVIQVQAFFTMGIAALMLREKSKFFQILGAIVASMGIGVVALHMNGDVTTVGLVLCLTSAMSWAIGNIIAKTLGKVDMFAVVIWGSLFAFFPLAVLAYFIDGWDSIVHNITHISITAIGSWAYTVYVSTFVGYTLWNRMLAHYSAAMVAPFTLLLPAFGMASAALFLGETYPLWKLWATMFIITGLFLNQFGAKIQRYFVKPEPNL